MGEVDIEPYIGKSLRVVFPTAEKLYYVPFDNIVRETEAPSCYKTSNKHDVFAFNIYSMDCVTMYRKLFVAKRRKFNSSCEEFIQYLTEHGILLDYSF